MAEFSELIKNFNKCRDYVRDFFVYGFKSRQDFTSDKKSARTYDDERRRITSWLSAYVVEDMTESKTTLHTELTKASDAQTVNPPAKTRNRVKNISLQLDSNLLDTNPLFSVWKTKSFTDNDILLHFFLLDILNDSSYSANDLADILSEDHSFPADTQLVRRKCNEYVKEGLLRTEKDGKTLLYRKGLTWEELFISYKANTSQETISDYTSLRTFRKDTINCLDSCNSMTDDKPQISKTDTNESMLINAISLFQLDLPFGYIGNTILEKLSRSNKIFRIKHSFPAFTLEEEIAYQLLSAKNDHSYVKLEIMSNKTGQKSRPMYGVPLKIFVSTRTGRRYICLYQMIRERKHNPGNESIKPRYHFQCVRLDQIKTVTALSPDDVPERKRDAVKASTEAFDAQEQALMKNLPLVWGVSFEGMRTKVSLTLDIDEQYEGFILNRLDREGKSGTVTRLSDNTFLYEKTVFDANEMFPWLRTFIGRIIDIRFTIVNANNEAVRENTALRRKFLDDIEALTQLYI